MGFSHNQRLHFRGGLRLALTAAAVLCSGVVSAQTPGTQQKTMLVEPPAPLLPVTIDNLSRASQGDVGDGLGAVDPAQAPVLKEDGLHRFAQSDYTLPDTKDSRPRVNVAVYQF